MMSCCAVCKAPANQRCSGCQQVVYCNRDHQRQHWKATHRRECCCYRVEQNACLGRHLVATRNIRQGEIILTDTAYVAGPKMVSVPVCLGCNRDLMPLLQLSGANHFHECSGCGWPLCGAECEKSDQHRHECIILARSGYRPKLYPDFNNVHKRETAYCVIVPLRLLLLERNAPEKYAHIQTFESHLAQRLQSPLYEVVRSNVVPFARTVLGLRQYTEQHILQVCGILDTNCYEVLLPHRHTKIRALYPWGAMLSHDCKPNTKHYFDASMNMILVATTDIPQSAIITVSYTQPLLGTLHRRIALKQAKLFDCQCDRCADPTEFGTNISGFRCPQCRGGFVLPSQPTDYRTPWRCQRRKCSFQEPINLYVARCERLEKELMSLDKTDPKSYDSFLERYGTVLHGWNAYVLQAKYALLQLLVNSASGEGEKKDQIECRARRVIELCRDLLEVADRLEPGFGVFRGKLLVKLETSFGILNRLGSMTNHERGKWQAVKDEILHISKTDPSVVVSI
ncbi:SET domain-containing protein SmydA-8-like isoform X1 [Anopheles cruzii]|uniref:SET domain-containing protein SmydA-8-like isoform X1 n=1 Tax=Anopheles cruzii TaxID=68878 RepID=UPI0022EC8BF9|nr:SET domain-containing protein SmydA-8-like isoform X1 [Anopheles cruzii]